MSLWDWFPLVPTAVSHCLDILNTMPSPLWFRLCFLTFGLCMECDPAIHYLIKRVFQKFDSEILGFYISAKCRRHYHFLLLAWIVASLPSFYYNYSGLWKLWHLSLNPFVLSQFGFFFLSPHDRVQGCSLMLWIAFSGTANLSTPTLSTNFQL